MLHIDYNKRHQIAFTTRGISLIHINYCCMYRYIISNYCCLHHCKFSEICRNHCYEIPPVLKDCQF